MIINIGTDWQIRLTVERSWNSAKNPNTVKILYSLDGVSLFWLFQCHYMLELDRSYINYHRRADFNYFSINIS